MNWGNLKEQIRDLGFEDDSIFSEYQSVIINAVNRAVKLINTNIIPVQGKYEFTQNGASSGIERHDLSEITDSLGNYIFETLIGVPTRIYRNEYYAFNNYAVEQGHIIVIDSSIPGSFTFFFKQRLPDITASTPDDYIVPIDKTVEPLLPLLAAHYVWLDDEEQKAVMYYNEYVEMKNEILNAIREKESLPKATIYGGVDWS